MKKFIARRDVPGTPSAGSARIACIDLMEVLAMLFVVAYHLSVCSYKFLGSSEIEAYVNYYLRCVFVCCVPLFLITNGFLLFRHSFDLKQHLKKTLRYVLLTLFWGVLTLLAYNRAYGISFGLRSFLEDLFTWRGGVIYLWYMGALVIIYLLFPLLKLVYDRNPKLLLYFAGILAVMTFGNKLLNLTLTIIKGLMGKEQVWVSEKNWFSMFNPVPGIPGYTLVYFCLGAFLQQFMDYLERFSRRRKNLLAGLGLVVFTGLHALTFGFLWKSIGYYYCSIWFGYDTVTAVLITLCVLVLCSGYRGTWRPGARLLQLVSSNTLGIYFMHMIFVHTLRNHLLTIEPLYNFPGTIFYAAGIMAVCLVIILLLRRIPGIRKLVS